MSRYVCLWEFRVKPESVGDFERTYGPDGDWARLFRRGAGYVRTELLRELGAPDENPLPALPLGRGGASTAAPRDPGRFVTIDHWRSRADFERFQADFAAEYAALDAACAAYTLDERLIGHFVAAP